MNRAALDQSVVLRSASKRLRLYSLYKCRAATSGVWRTVPVMILVVMLFAACAGTPASHKRTSRPLPIPTTTSATTIAPPATAQPKKLQTSGPHTSLADITFVSAEDGWVVGYHCSGSGDPFSGSASTAGNCYGIVLRTVDAGKVWQQEAVVAVPLYGVQFLNAYDGFAWGSTQQPSPYAQLYRTTNGGLAWQKLTLNPTEFYEFVSFANPADGWAINWGGSCATDGQCPFDIYATSDGGNTWHKIATAGLALTANGQKPPVGVAVLGGRDISSAGYFGGSSGWFTEAAPWGGLDITTNDWKTELPNEPSFGGGGGGGGLAAFGGPAAPEHGWAIWANQSRPPVEITANMGRSWYHVANLSTLALTIAAASDGNSAWVTTTTNWSSGTSTALTVISSAGSISSTNSTGGFNLFKLAPLNSQQAWALTARTGQPYSIVHTTNSGATWQVQYRVAGVSTTTPSPYIP